MNIPIIGDAIEGVSKTVQSYFDGKKEQVKAKAEKAVETAKAKADAKITQLKEEGESERQAIKAEAGTKRALIKRNLRLMRRVTLAVLLAPYVAGALIIAGTYAVAVFTGNPPAPDFTPLELFWAKVVGGSPDWWVKALQGVFAFLWAGGEITNVSAQAGGAVMDHLERRGHERAREKEAEAKAKQADAKAERERRNREREERGEEPLPDEDDSSSEGARADSHRPDIPNLP